MQVKYKIVTDGRKYRIKIKRWWGWEYAGDVIYNPFGACINPISWSCLEKAERWASDEYGNNRERVRQWRVC
jgi:hypothetical protein